MARRPAWYRGRACRAIARRPGVDPAVAVLDVEAVGIVDDAAHFVRRGAQHLLHLGGRQTRVVRQQAPTPAASGEADEVPPKPLATVLFV